MDLEADRADAQPDGLCRAEEPGGFAVTAGLAGQSGEALEDVGNEQVCLDSGGARERVVGVALGLVPTSPVAIATRARSSAPPPSTSRSLVETASSAQPRAAARSPSASAASAFQMRCAARALPVTTLGPAGRPARISCAAASIPGGQGRVSQRHVPEYREHPAKLRGRPQAASAAARAAAASPWYASARL